jgi:hypothetical protein
MRQAGLRSAASDPLAFSIPLFVFVWLASFAAHAGYVEIYDDHFDRITRGYQIAEHGAVPFRDFYDPGYFLTIYSSAAAQLLSGRRLVGEVVLSGVFMAGGIALAAAMVRMVTRSWAPALGAALLLVLAQPRPYDYDKVLFYALGLYACWQYAERRSTGAAIALGVIAALAGLYRYDNGAFVVAAAAATLVGTHWGNWRLLLGRAALLAGAGLLTAAPAVLFVATHGGTGEAVRQIGTYAVREAQRTSVFAIPEVSIDWEAPLLQIDPPTVASGWLTRPNAEAAIFFLFWALTLAAAAALFVRGHGRFSSLARARGLSAVTLSALANFLILRDPIASRYAAGLIPILVLAAWLFSADGLARGSSWWRLSRRLAASAFAGVAALAVVILSAWPARLGPLLEPGADPLQALLREDAERWSEFTTEPDASAPTLAGYLSRCTRPGDRVLVAGYYPETAFVAGRAFAGGMLAFFGNHWSSTEDQQRIVGRLRAESVPLIVMTVPDGLDDYPQVATYVEEAYLASSDASFGDDPTRFLVWIRRELASSAGADEVSGLPCPAI